MPIHSRLPLQYSVYWHLVILLLLVTLGLSSTTSNAIGFTKIDSEDFHLGIWYPSHHQPTLERLGPFEVEIALNAPIQTGQYEIVLFSHGNGGRFRNHYITAQALANAGYIVIAPQHDADYLVGGNKTAQVLNYRYQQLKRALHIVRDKPQFRDHIAPTPVHGVGYSLGGATIMLASGAGFSSELTDQYCRQKEDLDPEFCNGPSIYQMLASLIRDEPNLGPKQDPFRNPPLITGKAILIAPVFHGLDLQQPLTTSSLTVIGIAGDQIAKPELHAKPLVTQAKEQTTANFTSVQGHHFAFIAPFPKWLTDKEDIPVAKDPAGFNRPDFLATVNAIIVKAMLED